MNNTGFIVSSPAEEAAPTFYATLNKVRIDSAVAVEEAEVLEPPF